MKNDAGKPTWRARMREAAKKAKTARLTWICCGTRIGVADRCPRCGGFCR